jgi:hypothetical protein
MYTEKIRRDSFCISLTGQVAGVVTLQTFIQNVDLLGSNLGLLSDILIGFHCMSPLPLHVGLSYAVIPLNVFCPSPSKHIPDYSS